nr:MAG TPA: hypothetical protein [Caudoviricetes sp.]
MINEELETKVLHFLVAALGGHSVTIVRHEPVGVGRIVGFSVGKNRSFAIRDLLELISGPDDGRPCAMDKFVADLFEACDDPLDRIDAIDEWLHGDWPAAMAYLKDEDEPGEHQEVLDAIDACNSGEDK